MNQMKKLKKIVNEYQIMNQINFTASALKCYKTSCINAQISK